MSWLSVKEGGGGGGVLKKKSASSRSHSSLFCLFICLIDCLLACLLAFGGRNFNNKKYDRVIRTHLPEDCHPITEKKF